MAIHPIIKAPDPRLKRKCAKVGNVTDSVRTLLDDMLETMYAAPGVGLSAPQVGALLRVVVVDVAALDQPRNPVRLIDPELIETSDELVQAEEGCLSFPDQFAEVERPIRVRVRYLDEENKICEMEADGMLATCIQHEMDHLDGILFVDHLSKLKRSIILRKMQKLRKAETTVGA